MTRSAASGGRWADRLRQRLGSIPLFARILRWKTHVNDTLNRQEHVIADLQATVARVEAALWREVRGRDTVPFVTSLLADNTHSHIFDLDGRLAFARRGATARIVRIPLSDPRHWLVTCSAGDIAVAISRGDVRSLQSAHLLPDGTLSSWRQEPELMHLIESLPDTFATALEWFEQGRIPMQRLPAAQRYEHVMALVGKSPDLLDFCAQAHALAVTDVIAPEAALPPPFDRPEALPPLTVPAEPRLNSVVFLGHSYYHFSTLAAALRKRGWNAVSVSTYDPGAEASQFYVAEDISLFDPDPELRRRKIGQFLKEIPEKFGALHFYGMNYASLFQANYEHGPGRTTIPWDFLELRRHRTLIGYAPSGCMDGGRQSSIRRISQNVCGRCVWELQPATCSDERSGAWARTLEEICDWVGLEGDWAVDERCGPKFVRGPVTTALDPETWSPDIAVPKRYTVKKKGEILVYHAVGNMKIRRVGDRDIKGSGAVERAIAKLQTEGQPLKLYFATDLHISEVPYVKVQADIVIDQLNYGRLGANAREALMLGRPLITRLMPEQQAPLPPLRSVGEAPALDATEATVEQALRDLVRDPESRARMGAQSRTFALKWFAADACARRFEMVIDRVRVGLPAESDELYPQPEPKSLSEPRRLSTGGGKVSCVRIVSPMHNPHSAPESCDGST